MSENNAIMQGGSIAESCVLQISDLHKSYGSHPVLEGVSFSIPRGKIVGLLGPNGCGKSTIMKMISGLLPADNGSILIDGHLPGLVSKSIVSYLPERTYLNDWMKVSEVLQFFSDFYADFDLERAQQMLADLHLSPNTRLKTMSKGTKEKVQLILVMSRRAQLYLLDEPIGGVDPAAREYILNTILKNFDESSSILITTHLIQDVEAIFDQVLFLNQGKIVIDGEVDEIRQQHGKSIDRLFREVFKC